MATINLTPAQMDALKGTLFEGSLFITWELEGQDFLLKTLNEIQGDIIRSLPADRSLFGVGPVPELVAIQELMKDIYRATGTSALRRRVQSV